MREQHIVQRQTLASDPNQCTVIDAVDPGREVVPRARLGNGRRRFGHRRLEIEAERFGLSSGILVIISRLVWQSFC